MKKTLWTIFKVVTFGFGILYYIGLVGLIIDELKSKSEPSVQPIMFMNRK